MLDYQGWRELVVAFVQVEAWRQGWTCVSVDVASTGSAYVKLQHPVTGLRVRLRVSDHRGSARRLRAEGWRLLSIRRATTGRIREVAHWLKRVLQGRGAQTPPFTTSPNQRPRCVCLRTARCVRAD